MTSGTSNDHLSLAYLHPEVLATDSLIKILKERCVKPDKIEGMTRSQLLELFYDYVLPLPQRIYGLGRRAQRLTLNRKKRETLKRKSDESDSGESKKMCKSQTSVDINDKSKDTSPSSEGSKRSYKLVNKGAVVLNQDKNHAEKEPTKRPDRETQESANDETSSKKPKRTPISWP